MSICKVCKGSGILVQKPIYNTESNWNYYVGCYNCNGRGKEIEIIKNEIEIISKEV